MSNAKRYLSLAGAVAATVAVLSVPEGRVAAGVDRGAAMAAGADSGAGSVIPDPVPAYPGNYKVLFENGHVRVLDFRLAKGDTERPHAHPANVAVFLSDFTIRFALPDGTTKMRVGRPGDVAYSDAVVHSPTNVGDTDAHGILVELKDGDGAATTPRSGR